MDQRVSKRPRASKTFRYKTCAPKCVYYQAVALIFYASEGLFDHQQFVNIADMANHRLF